MLIRLNEFLISMFRIKSNIQKKIKWGKLIKVSCFLNKAFFLIFTHSKKLKFIVFYYLLKKKEIKCVNGLTVSFKTLFNVRDFLFLISRLYQSCF